MEDAKNVLVYGELTPDGLSSITKELLGGARKLADDLGEELHILFLGEQAGGGPAESLAFGADRAYVVEDPRLAHYEGAAFTPFLVAALDALSPRILLLGHTDIGADLGPRIAFARGLPIATDCVVLSLNNETKRLVRTKPVHGGLAMAVLESGGFPEMATVRPKSLTPAEKKEASADNVTKMTVTVDKIDQSVKILGRAMEETKGVSLADAEIIVSGGRGMGGPDGFRQLEEMGKMFNAAVGGSRVAVDNGWIPTSSQVGLTGTIVAPRVYIAIGISGASQHMTGCARSQRIIAINKDAAAPIFKQSHYGVVGDWKDVLPAFMKRLKELG